MNADDYIEKMDAEDSVVHCAIHSEPITTSCDNCDTPMCARCVEEGSAGGDHMIGGVLTACPTTCASCLHSTDAHDQDMFDSQPGRAG